MFSKWPVSTIRGYLCSKYQKALPRPRPSLILLLGVHELKKWHFKKDKWQVTKKKKTNQDSKQKTDPYSEEKNGGKKKANIGFILDFGHFVSYSFALTVAKNVDSGGKLISTFVLHSGRSFHILIDDD